MTRYIRMMVNCMRKQKKIGIDVPAPKESCSDKKCPFHGETKVRGRTFVGKVVKVAFQKNALVEWEAKSFIPKYERYKKKRTRLWAHCAPCIGVNIGDTVRIMETRKLSKTKNFVVVQKQ